MSKIHAQYTFETAELTTVVCNQIQSYNRCVFIVVVQPLNRTKFSDSFPIFGRILSTLVKSAVFSSNGFWVKFFSALYFVNMFTNNVISHPLLDILIRWMFYWRVIGSKHTHSQWSLSTNSYASKSSWHRINIPVHERIYYTSNNILYGKKTICSNLLWLASRMKVKYKWK